jgi:hypothetical protein
MTSCPRIGGSCKTKCTFIRNVQLTTSQVVDSSSKVGDPAQGRDAALVPVVAALVPVVAAPGPVVALAFLLR